MWGTTTPSHADGQGIALKLQKGGPWAPRSLHAWQTRHPTAVMEPHACNLQDEHLWALDTTAHPGEGGGGGGGGGPSGQLCVIVSLTPVNIRRGGSDQQLSLCRSIGNVPACSRDAGLVVCPKLGMEVQGAVLAQEGQL